MRFGSVCSGIEAASVAWHPLGWRAAFLSEIEKFPCAMLAHHYPDVPNYGDMTRYQEWPDAAIDVLVGGTPCQGNSVAGLRLGLDDPRSQLMLTYGEIAARYRPRWLVWENVPGVLSVNGGCDFAALLGLLSGRHIHPPAGGWKNSGIVEGIPSAYGLAWRVLDAQYIRVDSHARAVPQRRRRVFVVGHLGDWRRAAAVLFEREGLQGHPAPRREAGQGFAVDTAPSLRAQSQCSHRADSEAYVPVISPALKARDYKGPSSDGDGDDAPLIAFAHQQGGSVDLHHAENVGLTLQRNQTQAIVHMAVRRLTPRECARLQGFPDDYLDITYRGKPAADGPKYKAFGNAMAIPPMSWIGQRIQLMEEIGSAALGDGDTAA